MKLNRSDCLHDTLTFSIKVCNWGTKGPLRTHSWNYWTHIHILVTASWIRQVFTHSQTCSFHGGTISDLVPFCECQLEHSQDFQFWLITQCPFTSLLGRRTKIVFIIMELFVIDNRLSLILARYYYLVVCRWEFLVQGNAILRRYYDPKFQEESAWQNMHWIYSNLCYHSHGFLANASYLLYILFTIYPTFLPT